MTARPGRIKELHPTVKIARPRSAEQIQFGRIHLDQAGIMALIHDERSGR